MTEQQPSSTQAKGKGLFALDKFASSPLSDDGSIYSNDTSNNDISNMIEKLFDTLVENIKHSMENNEETANLDQLSLKQLQQSLESLDIIHVSLQTLNSIFGNENVNRETFSNKIINNDSDEDHIYSFCETIKSEAKKYENNNNNNNSNGDNSMFFGTRKKSMSVIDNDSTGQLKDALNKKHEKHRKSMKNKRQSSKSPSGYHDNNTTINEENGNEDTTIDSNEVDSNNNNNNNNSNDNGGGLTPNELNGKMVKFSDMMRQKSREREEKQDKKEKAPNLLRILQKSARHDPNFGDVFNSDKWTSQEVCYWLITIGLENTIYKFYSKAIDGSMLLDNVNNDKSLKQFLDKHEIKLHKSEMTKLLQEIMQLKQQLKNGDSRRNSLVVNANVNLSNDSDTKEEKEKLAAMSRLVGELKGELNELKQEKREIKESHQREMEQLNSIVNQLKSENEMSKEENNRLQAKLRKSQSDALSEYVELTIAAIKINFAEVAVSYQELRDRCKDVPFHKMYQELTDFMKQKMN